MALEGGVPAYVRVVVKALGAVEGDLAAQAG
jgi:hypothetical protein